MANGPIQFRNNFIFFNATKFDQNIVGECLVLQSGRLQECLNYIKLNNIRSLMINDNYFLSNDLTFLTHINNLEGLYIASNRVDTSPISSCSKLKLLRTEILTSNLDLDNLSKIEVLSIPNFRNVSHISSCNLLIWAEIDGYSNSDLKELSNLKLLKFLRLNAPQVISLKGVEHLHCISLIELNDAKKLESLNGLEESNKELEHINVWNAKHLTDYTALEKAVNIKIINLRRTGETENIYFINKLTKLESITLGFKVANGDLSLLDRIKEVGFIEFKHYNRKMKDFNK